LFFCLAGNAQRDEQRDQHQQAEDHAERIRVDVTGLQQPRRGGDPSN
jgi:hypothetical protein